MSNYEKSNSKAHSNFWVLVPYQRESDGWSCEIGRFRAASSSKESTPRVGTKTTLEEQATGICSRWDRQDKKRARLQQTEPGSNHGFSMDKLSSKNGPSGENCVPGYFEKENHPGREASIYSSSCWEGLTCRLLAAAERKECSTGGRCLAIHQDLSLIIFDSVICSKTDLGEEASDWTFIFKSQYRIRRAPGSGRDCRPSYSKSATSF